MKTLSPLLYLHDHFVDLSELVVGLMTKCNFKGEYIVNEDIPKDVEYISDKAKKEFAKKLDECKQFRNEN